MLLCCQEEIGDDYCGHATVNAVTRNSPLSGDVALSSSASVVFSQSRVIAVTSTTCDNHTVIFAGTADGRIIKVRDLIAKKYLIRK